MTRFCSATSTPLTFAGLFVAVLNLGRAAARAKLSVHTNCCDPFTNNSQRYAYAVLQEEGVR